MCYKEIKENYGKRKCRKIWPEISGFLAHPTLSILRHQRVKYFDFDSLKWAEELKAAVCSRTRINIESLVMKLVFTNATLDVLSVSVLEKRKPSALCCVSRQLRCLRHSQKKGWTMANANKNQSALSSSTYLELLIFWTRLTKSEWLSYRKYEQHCAQ